MNSNLQLGFELFLFESRSPYKLASTVMEKVMSFECQNICQDGQDHEQRAGFERISAERENQGRGIGR